MQVLEEGQYIKHEQYGVGIVADSDAERTTIDFQGHGRKIFVTSLWSAELMGEAPAKPIRPRRRKAAARTTKAKVASRG